MPKSVKKPEDRRNEFIAVAEELFNEKGFESTSIDDIVERMGVAKGLFYYYFGSKEELLAAILERMIEESRAAVEAAMSKEGLTAMERFRELIESNKVARSRSQRLIAYFHEERNRALHLSMEVKIMEFLVPATESIIRQGIAEGVFETAYPRETAIALLSVYRGIGHQARSPLDAQQILRMTEVLQYLTERLLGAEPGTFTVLQESLPPEIREKAQEVHKRS